MKEVNKLNFKVYNIIFSIRNLGILILAFYSFFDLSTNTSIASNLDKARRYASCMALARGEPQKAVDVAKEWFLEQGEGAAGHCYALALLNNGRYEDAARKFESLTKSKHLPLYSMRVDLFSQAGQAWLIAGKFKKALKAQTSALELKGSDVELLLDRAITLAGMGNYWMAIDDLNTALDQAPNHVNTLILRATAWRKLKNLELAADDIVRALDISPENVDAILEKGNIRALQGAWESAIIEWRRVLELDSKSNAAVAAKANVARHEMPFKP